MDSKSLEKNLANLEREILALQTAHDIGLGAVGFYEYEGDYMTFPNDLGYGMYSALLITVQDGERPDPVMNVFVSSIYEDNSTGFAFVERFSPTKFDTFAMRPMGQLPQIQMHYKVVSSSKLNVKPCESEQEYWDFVNG